MNYIDAIAKAIGERCDLPWGDPENIRLLRMYALVCLCKGTDATDADTHDAWSAWETELFPNHRNITPFALLDQKTKSKDRKYTKAIREVARMPCRYFGTTGVRGTGGEEFIKPNGPKGQLGQ